MINTIDHIINIDLASKINMNQSINIKKNDTNSHKFIINIFNNSVAYDLTGSTSRIYFEKADGNKVFLDCILDNTTVNKLSVLLTTQTLTFAGLVASEITIYGTSGEILTSVTFNFNVLENIRNDVAIESVSEFTALTTALVKIDTAVESIGTIDTLNTILEGNISTGDALDVKLKANIEIGNTTDANVKASTALGNTTDVALKADIVLAGQNSFATEIVTARGGEVDLPVRLNKVTTSLAHITQENAKLITSFGAITGVTDDYATLMNAHNTMKSGDILLITKPVMLKTPIIWTKKIDIQCIGDKGYFIADVGALNDAFTVSSLAVNSVNLKINVYGLANCCKNALVMDCINLSTITAKIKAGATGYGYVSKGCLLTTHNIHISSNYPAPLIGAIMPANMILLDTGVSIFSESNACKFNLKLEGGNGNGVVKTNTNVLGTVEFTGCIEGINGKPFDITNARYSNINNMHLELNDLASIFTDCKTIAVGPGVRNNTMLMKFSNTTGITIDGYTGSLEFNSACTGTVNNIGFDANDTITNNSKAISINGVVTDFANATKYGLKNIGFDAIENFFHNPFMDIWSLGSSSVPDGWKGTGLTWTKETTIVYRGNPRAVSAYVQSTTTSVNTGANTIIKPGYFNMATDRWVNIAIPIYVPTGQPNVRVYLFNTSSFLQIQEVTEKNVWVLITGAALITTGKSIDVAIRPYNAGYVAGNYYIGGLTIANGKTPPSRLLDNGKRNEHIVTSISFAPSFVGQRAFIVATGKWYMASGVLASTDWSILN